MDNEDSNIEDDSSSEYVPLTYGGQHIDSTDESLEADERSPWRGLVDIVWVFIAGQFVALVLTVMALLVFGEEIESSTGLNISLGNSLIVIFLSQSATFIFSYLVQSKSVGPKLDLRFKFKPSDIFLGPLLAIWVVAIVSIVNQLMSSLLDVTEDEASNTAILSDAKEGSPWVVALVILVVVVGAPLSEEIFYRGVVFRVVENISKKLSNFASWWAPILFSSLFFMVVHPPSNIGTDDFSWNGQFVLWGSIFTIAIILGAAAKYFDRLGPTIIAHGLFNLVATTAVLFGSEVPEEEIEVDSKSSIYLILFASVCTFIYYAVTKKSKDDIDEGTHEDNPLVS